MSQNKKKFFGKHKDEQEQDLEQTQPLPPVPENAADESSQPEENAAPEEASEEAVAAEKKNEKAEQLAEFFRKKFNLSKRVRVIIAAGLIILLVGGSVFAVIRSHNTGTEVTISTTAVVTYGDIGTYIEGSGETSARNTEELGLGLEGKITQVLVSEDDEVHAGDPLVVVDPTEVREQLTAAQAEFTTAQSELTNAQAAITQAQSRIASAQSQYTHSSATAPFSGKFIASSTFAVGQKVSAGQTIGRMVNDSQMQLAVQFSSEYAKDIKVGQTATVSTSAGQVSATVSSIDSASGESTFLVVLTMQNSGSLTQGTSASATINSDSAGTIFSSGSGKLEYISEQVITAPIGGEITAYNGSNRAYSSGAVIMSISNVVAPDTSDARSSLTAAQSTAAAAQAKVSEIQTRILELQQQILDATMTASIDGVVTSLNAEEGEDTDGTEPLVVVSDLNDTVVTAELTADEVQSVEPGQTVTMNMYTMDGSELPLTGTVDSVSPEPTQNTGSQGSLTTFKAIITVDSIEGQAISSGMMVDYKIAVAESDSCLMVPNSAIVHTEDGSTGVFTKTLIDKDGNEIPFDETLPIPDGMEAPEGYQLVAVETGASDANNTEIFWGVDEGATVYLNATPNTSNTVTNEENAAYNG